MLARQLRLRLVAGDDLDVPRNLHNIVVSIHAIATFQALHDYLRPRVAGLLNGGSRLHGMLAALAASGFSGGPRGGDAGQSPKPPAAPPAESSSAATSGSASTIGQRRSQRLSAKNATASVDEANQDPNHVPSATEPTGDAPSHPRSRTFNY